MRPKPVERVLEATLQVLIQRLFRSRRIIVGNRSIEDAPIARLLQVCRDAKDQPVRVIIEITAHVVVAALRKWLVLVVRAATRQLRGGQIEYPLSRPRRNHMHEAKQILIGITEAHAAPNAAFKVRSRTAHVEGHHALIGIPDVDHAIGVFIGRIDLQFAQ